MRRPNIRGSQTSGQHDPGFRTPLLSYRWQVLSADPPAFNAWSLLSLTATAHGVLAYPDELGVRYVYDTTVPNGRYVTLGDLAVVRDNRYVFRRRMDRQHRDRLRSQDQVPVPELHEHRFQVPQQEAVRLQVRQMHWCAGAWDPNPRGRVNALMVFKSVRNSLSSSVATWAFSGRVHHVTQDHPVYIPRDLNCSVSCRQRRVQLQVPAG